jgi:hypothetical protein
VNTLAITIVVALVVLGIWWLLRPAKPSLNEPLTPEMVHAVIDTLLYQGLDGGELRIVTRGGPTAFRLIKYVRPSEGAGFFAEVSKLDGYQEYYDNFLEELRTRGIAHRVLNSAPDAVQVHLGHDIGQARFLTVLFFERSMGARLARDCVAYFNDKVLPITSPLTGMVRSA